MGNKCRHVAYSHNNSVYANVPPVCIVLSRSTILRTQVSILYDMGSTVVVMVLVLKGFAWRRVLSAVISMGCSAVGGGFPSFLPSFLELYLKEKTCFLSEVCHDFIFLICFFSQNWLSVGFTLCL